MVNLARHASGLGKSSDGGSDHFVLTRKVKIVVIIYDFADECGVGIKLQFLACCLCLTFGSSGAVLRSAAADTKPRFHNN